MLSGDADLDLNLIRMLLQFAHDWSHFDRLRARAQDTQDFHHPPHDEGVYHVGVFVPSVDLRSLWHSRNRCALWPFGKGRGDSQLIQDWNSRSPKPGSVLKK